MIAGARAAARVLARPVREAARRRRAVHLLVGAGLALALAVPLVAAIELAPLALLTPAALVAAGFSPAVRALERAQANALLGTALAGATLDDAPAGDGRRTVDAGVVAWLALRAALGAAGTLALLAGAFALTAGLIAPFDPGFFAGDRYRSPGGLEAAWFPVAGAAVLLASVHGADALGRLEARAAPKLLALTAAEEVAFLRARTETLIERERLARELHDSVGHAVTVTLLQARAAGRLLDRDVEAARRSLATIEEVSRTTMTELDRVLTLLRGEGGSDGDAPEDLAELGRGLRAAGLPFDLDLDEPGVISGLPVAVRTAAYRIVQEAATNVLRHSGPVPTRAEVRLDGSALAVRVTSARPADPPRASAAGSRRGLTGMRDRARALGGVAAFGPAEDGGWVVEARLPVEGSS